MAKRRGHQEGSIYQDQSRGGSWVAELDLGRDSEGKRRRKRRVTRTRREAQRALAEMKAEATAGANLRGPDVRVEFLLARVVEGAAARDVQPKTIDNYEWAAQHLADAFGAMRARDLTALDVEDLLQRLATDRRLSHSSLQRVRGTLAQALDEGLRLDWLTRNVATVARVPKSHRTERRALSADEAAALMEAAEGGRLHAAVVLGITCGLRPGELLALGWADVSTEEPLPTVAIRASLASDATGTYRTKPKTNSSARSIVLSSRAAAALRGHRAAQAQTRLRAGNAWTDNGLVFPNEVGGFWDPHNFRRSFRKLTSATGLGPLPPYTMRHTMVTLLSEEQVPAERIADLAGHRDTRMVERVYRHRTGAAVAAGAEEMDRLFG